jgi:hypothetical protein
MVQHVQYYRDPKHKRRLFFLILLDSAHVDQIR